MSLLSYHELCDLVGLGAIQGVQPGCINGTSIDVHLGAEIMREINVGCNVPVSLKDKMPLNMYREDITQGDGFYLLKPNEFILAHTIEKFNLPSDISAEFKLNSSGARIGLDNALATWCDPGWHGSVLTLELKNLTRFHTIRLDYNCRIGQMIFHRSMPVPSHCSYAVRGRYNQDTSVSTVKE